MKIASILLVGIFSLCHSFTLNAQKQQPLFDSSFTANALVWPLTIKIRLFKKDKIEFGPFRVTKAKLRASGGDRRGISAGTLIGYAKIEDFSFWEIDVSDGNDTCGAELMFESKRKEFSLWILGIAYKEKQKFSVDLYPCIGGRSRMGMARNENFNDALFPDGEFLIGDTPIKVRYVELRAGKLIKVRKAYGFEFFEGGERIAAVDMSRQPRVMLLKTLDAEKRSAVGLAIMSILYQYRVVNRSTSTAVTSTR